ncbi:MAG: hypothetical protein GXY86_12190 [Firmicutes bacterium]|nr:hypothetical protein [Bacillota bacterium]
MKKRTFFKNLRIPLLIIGMLTIGWGAVSDTPVYALGPFLRINVTPSNISFTVVDAEEPEEYYSANQEVTVVSQHLLGLEDFIRLKLPWHLGIRATDAYLKDSMSSENQIPISQLHWSKDGRNFQQFSQQWVKVNSYFDYYKNQNKETITYRLYSEPGQSLPAGLYTVRIEFDIRWFNFPWR